MSSFTFKVVLLGDGCVGKTSLVLRYVSNVFNESHQSTIQASFLQKQIYLEQDLVKLKIWDTAGQEKFNSLVSVYYREANGALLVYDVSNRDSLLKVRNWVKELNRILGVENVVLAIVGNKTDLLGDSQEEGELLESAGNSCIIKEAIEFTNELFNAKHYLTSAKLNQGVVDVFLSLTNRMVDDCKKRRFTINSTTSLAYCNNVKLGEGDDIFRVDTRINVSRSDTSNNNNNNNGRKCCWK